MSTDEILFDAESSAGAFAIHEVAKDLGVVVMHMNTETSSLTADPKLRIPNAFNCWSISWASRSLRPAPSASPLRHTGNLCPVLAGYGGSSADSLPNRCASWGGSPWACWS